MRVLFIGDIFGKPGRSALRALLPKLARDHKPDLILANGENLAGGAGITPETCREMLSLGIQALTTGNHVWDRKEAAPYLQQSPPVLRPLNYPEGTPGRGSLIIQPQDLLLVNLQGRVFMRNLDDPFRAVDRLLDGERHRFALVDFHAEATAEKKAMAFHLDGRVSAMVGTHTHVPTADAQVLPNGTGFISDVGMVGPSLSIIGNDPAQTLRRYLTQMPGPNRPAAGPVQLDAALIDLDDSTGLTRSITSIRSVWP